MQLKAIDSNSVRARNPKPTLLLHACCAPCSSAVVERLACDYEISIFFYNPNIHPEDEYMLRRDELQKWCADVVDIPCVILDYEVQHWFERVSGLENEPERGRRCNRCFRLRLEKTAQYARDNNFDLFTTVLSISPHKRHERINRLGLKLADIYNVEFYPANFKKQNGFKRSVEISRELDFYRQNYCGCMFSQAASRKDKD